jgi:HK97 family phage portal protein
MRNTNAISKRLQSGLDAVRKGFGLSWGNGTTSGNGGNPWRVMLPGSQIDYKEKAGELWLNSAVSICIGWIADNLPEAELEVVDVKDDGTTAPVAGHPLVGLIQNPNPYYDDDVLWAATILSYCTDGNAYWYKARDGYSRVKELWYLPHWQVEPRRRPGSENFLDYYEYRPGGTPQELDPDDVIHFRFGMDPDNLMKGLSRLRPVLREIMTDNESATYTAALLHNMGVPGVIITPASPEGVLGDGVPAKLKALWRERVTGDFRGDPIIAPAAVRIEKLSFSPEELALDKIRIVPEARILGALRMPGMVVGLSVGDAQRTYSNYKEAREAANEDCLIPIGKRFVKTLNRQLKADFKATESQSLRWNYQNVRSMQPDRTEASKRAVIEYTGGIATLDEARSETGKPPATNGKGDEYCPKPAAPVPDKSAAAGDSTP